MLNINNYAMCDSWTITETLIANKFTSQLLIIKLSTGKKIAVLDSLSTTRMPTESASTLFFNLRRITSLVRVDFTEEIPKINDRVFASYSVLFGAFLFGQENE